eukprot:365630-Chlamydomonas_euryale.AAC.2
MCLLDLRACGWPCKRARVRTLRTGGQMKACRKACTRMHACASLHAGMPACMYLNACYNTAALPATHVVVLVRRAAGIQQGRASESFVRQGLTSFFTGMPLWPPSYSLLECRFGPLPILCWNAALAPFLLFARMPLWPPSYCLLECRFGPLPILCWNAALAPFLFFAGMPLWPPSYSLLECRFGPSKIPVASERHAACLCSLHCMRACPVCLRCVHCMQATCTPVLCALHVWHPHACRMCPTHCHASQRLEVGCMLCAHPPTASTNAILQTTYTNIINTTHIHTHPMRAAPTSSIARRRIAWSHTLFISASSESSAPPSEVWAHSGSHPVAHAPLLASARAQPHSMDRSGTHGSTAHAASAGPPNAPPPPSPPPPAGTSCFSTCATRATTLRS